MGMKYLQQSDFDCIGQVAKHCNLDKLCIAETEAFDFDLLKFLCDYFFEVEENWENEDEEWQKILNGTEWIGCGGKKRRHKGIKTLLVYLTYSRYILINNYDDTASGGARKTAEFTIPKPLDELKDYSTKYRNMAKVVWNDVEAYLCFIGWKMAGCKSCGCNGSCGTKIGTRGFGAIAQNVTKYGL